MTPKDVSAFRFRNAVEDDVEPLKHLIEPFVERRLLLPRTDDELRFLMKHGFIAERDERIVGFAAVEIYSRKLAEIQCLAVASEFQGQGIGKELVQRCVERAREHQVRELMAITSSEGFLRECGFDYALPDQKKALFIQPSER